jgi:galactose mutarotase-like enzyme
LAIVALLASMFIQHLHAQPLVRVEQADFGKTREGSAVKLITLRNARGMRVQIITYGAIIKELWASDRNGNFTNVLLTAGSIQQSNMGLTVRPPSPAGW